MDTLRLLDEPFTFTQYRPLLARQFIDEAKKCGVWLSEQELEAFHRVRLLVPFYRLARDGREIAIAHRRGEDAYHLAHWQPTSRADLTDARTHDRLHDAASEPFIARRRLKRPLGEWSYESSVHLYSRHQLTALPFLRQVRPRLQLKRMKGDLVGRLDADRGRVEILRERAEVLRAAAIAATLLEPAYYSRIFHRMSLPRAEDFVAFDRWRRTRPLLRPLRALGVDAAWIKNAAESLHWEAHRIDPLGAWAELIAAAEPEKWKSLSGDARAAVEVRASGQSRQLRMEPLWSPVVAISGNRSQIRSAQKRLKDARTVAVGCEQLPKEFHGKGRVTATSLSEKRGHLPANAQRLVATAIIVYDRSTSSALG